MPITITSCTAGCVVDRLLDHLRIDVEAAGDDHVLLAVDQIEIAVGVHVADVAGEEAVADKGLRGFLRPVPVALGDVRAPDADFADFARRQHLASDRPATPRPARCRAASGRSSPACPGLPCGWPVPGEQVSVMPQPLFSFMPILRSKIFATSTGSGAPPEPQLTSDDKSRLSRSGRLAIAIHIVGTPGKRRRALDLDVAHHGLDVKALVQRDQIAAPERRQQHHRQRVDVEQRQHADHALDRRCARRAPACPRRRRSTPPR